jgi:hypothetical protein
VIEELVKAISPLFKFGGGFAEILYLLVLLQVLAFLVLQLPSRRVFVANDFWSCCCSPSIAIAWPFSTPSSVDLSLATSA